MKNDNENGGGDDSDECSDLDDPIYGIPQDEITIIEEFL
jgi:hypothetical protein